MNGVFRLLRRVATGAALTVTVAFPALADDIEIYLGGGSALSDVRPNVLVIIDTSGSMASLVATQGDYDPLVAYGGCFDPGRIYWSTGSPPTSCGTGAYFDPSVLACANATSIDTVGFNQDRFAAYNGKSWSRFSTRRRTRPVECRSDAGVHGPVGGDPNVYAANSGSGWSAAASSEVNWASTGAIYTLYSGNYLNYVNSGAVQLDERIDVVRDVIMDTIDAINGVNLGLMRFDRNGEGGMVTYALQDIAANRNNMKAEMLTYTPGGTTPLAETLYEAALYYRGDLVDYGNRSTPAHSAGEARISGDPKYYKTGVEYQCQKNYVILLTDGEPVSDTSADAKIAGLPGFSAATGKTACTNDHGNSDGKCLDEVAGFLYEGDQSGKFSGRQNVTTYTVGFATNQDLLKDTARAGGGSYFTADDAAGLASAFTNIFTEVLAVNSTFTSPAVSVNAFNRTTHRDELYFTLFEPAANPHWDGNVKKYRIEFMGPDKVATIVDSRGRPAVDQGTGFFADGSLSYWTQLANLPGGKTSDGGDTDLGGAASQLDATRTVYTYTGAGAPAGVVLSNPAHLLHESNAAVTADMIGLGAGATNPSRDELIQWARGLDIDGVFARPDNSRPVLGDPLHSKPVVVQYGGTEASPDLTIFVTTNDGYFHALRESDGTELFAFVPQDSAANLFQLYENTAAGARPYGLDGSVTTWVLDRNENGVIEPVNGDHVYVFFGMRRGGQNYYALDVTDRNNPVLMWQIEGGLVGGDYEELGQSWSDPSVIKIKYNGSERTVLAIGGGYDPGQDNAVVRKSDVEGRALFLVDAETGQRLWWAGPSGSGADLVLAELTNGIPSAVAPVDADGDGLTDIIYVGDTAAQVFRFDIDNSGVLGLSVRGGRIADLSKSASAQDARRFYYPPAVSYQAEPGAPSYFALALGSGYRAHPLNVDIRDRLYVLRDSNVFTPPSSYVTITENDLFDATDNVVAEGTEAARKTALAQLAASDGWYIVLKEPTGSFVGEKVLAKAQIIASTVVATSFAPLKPLEPCQPDAGRGYAYFIDITDGTPRYDFDELNGKTVADRRITLVRGGIPPSPTLVITEQGNVNLVGPEIVQSPDQGVLKKTYWSKGN